MICAPSGLSVDHSLGGWVLVLIALTACKLGSDDPDTRALPQALDSTSTSAERAPGTDEASRARTPSPKAELQAPTAPPAAGSSEQEPNAAVAPNPSTAPSAPGSSQIPNATPTVAPTPAPAMPASTATANSAGLDCMRNCQIQLARCLAPTDAGLPTIASVSACQTSVAQCQAACM